MAIPTLPQFKGSTRLSGDGWRKGALRDIRGKNIKKIDNWLGQYDRVRTGSPAQKQPILSGLLAECGHWLKKKLGANGGSTALRRFAILNLAREVYDEMRRLVLLHGVDHYNRRKIETLGGGAHPHPLHALSGGYANERHMYLAHHKGGNPFAAASVHESWENMNQGLLATGRLDPKLRGQYLALLARHPSFDALSVQDYEILGEVGRLGVGANNNIDVAFADKDARTSQLLVVWPGSRFNFEGLNRAAFDTTTEPDGYMYAMDSYGNLFASKPAGLSGGDIQYWNHSSFNSGKDVVCAGMIKIVGGRLTSVDNESGHYKPTRANLFELITAFDAEGIDLRNTVVGIKEPAIVGHGLVKHKVSALQFLANQNVQDPHPEAAL